MKNEDQPLNPDRIEQIFLMVTAAERHRVSAEKWNAHAARLGQFDFKKSKFFAMKGGKTPEDELLERISDAVAEELGGLAFDCIRDWSAWWAGTMRADDFLPIADDAERTFGIARAALNVVREVEAQNAPDAAPPVVPEADIWADISTAPSDVRLQLWCPGSHTYVITGRHWSDDNLWREDDTFQVVSPTKWKPATRPPQD